MPRRKVPPDPLSARWSIDRGLSSAEVDERRQRFGANAILETSPNPWWGSLRDAAQDPMLWFFCGTSLMYWLVGQRTESLTLLAAIAPLLGMDLFLHRRVQSSTSGLKSRLAATARVLRDGTRKETPAVELVPGDLVFLAPNELAPADGVMLAGDAAQVDESALTGESYPVGKRALRQAPLGGGDAWVDESSWLFAGTRLLAGQATLRVVFTGRETVYGEIVQSATSGAQGVTPLQLAMGRLVHALLGVAVVLCMALALVRLAQGHGWVDAVVSAVTLATAAIPEEFPVVFTFYLGLGVYRLARRQALVRRAVTVENIGRVTTICSDKTGTITEGRLDLSHPRPAHGQDEDRLLRLARLASRADSGDPLDEAILARGSIAASDEASLTRLATFPFTEDRKRETAILERADGKALAVTKGAAEVILDMTNLSDADRQRWRAEIQELADGAHKVLAVAARELPHAPPDHAEPEANFDFVGLLAFEDAVRDGVREAVAACQAAGIHTMMVTGDHAATAAAVARDVGLGGKRPRVLSGQELEAALAAGDSRLLRLVDVVARAKPAEKLRIVQSLRQMGEIVAVTGDGVNDVPALRAADIGVAMGERGTQAARESAAIVLMDDNFRTIVAAIGEGRQLFDNLRLSFMYLLVAHLPLVLTATFIPLAGYPLLYLPVHIVWLEMLIHPTAMLVFQEPPSRELARREERGSKARFFTNREWLAIMAGGLIIAAAVTAGFLRSLEGANLVEHGRAMALATYTLASACVTAALSRLRTRAAWFMSVATVATSLALIQTPFVSRRLHMSPLHWDDWCLALGAGILAAATLVVGRGARKAHP